MAQGKRTRYARLEEDLTALLDGERNWIANAANMAALLYEQLDDVNWAGFYFRHGDELVLGPFQGRPACVRIAMGKGVCGTAATQRETIVVANVHAFPGHIACDSASNAEIVVPIVQDGPLIGVLDIDSPIAGRFDDIDAKGLQRAVAVYLQATDLQPLTAP